MTQISNNSVSRRAIQRIAAEIRDDSATYSVSVNITAANLSNSTYSRLLGESQKAGFKRAIFASALVVAIKHMADDVSLVWRPPSRKAAKGFGLKLSVELHGVLKKSATQRFSTERLAIAMLEHALQSLVD